MEEVGEIDDMEEAGEAEELKEVGEEEELKEVEAEELKEVEEMEEMTRKEEQQEQPLNICDELLSPKESVPKNEVKVSEEVKEVQKGPLVLDPDHPMMKRFQEALKNYLLKQLNRVSDQIFEMENEIKKGEKEREETGQLLYGMQQQLFKQQKTLEDCESSIESLMKERQCLEESVNSKKLSRKEELNRLNCLKKKESEMMAELHRLSSLEKQMEKWKNEMESELSVSQRISHKTHYDKNKLIEEKRKMDMYLLRLMAVVSDSEWEIKLLDGEIEVKSEEKDSLNQTLADATADLQCLITEQKRLLNAWNSVITIINQRNTIYTEVNKELTKCQESFQSLNIEIQSYKRSSAGEMKESENLSIIMSRLQNEFESLEAALKVLSRKKEVVENKIVSTSSIIKKTAEDVKHTRWRNERNGKALQEILNKHMSIINKIREFEDETVTILHEQLITDSATANLGKMLKATREKYRQQEFSLLDTENKISQKFVEVEELKEIIARNNEILNEMNDEFNITEEDLKKINAEITKCHSAIINRQENYAVLVRKIEKHTELHGSLPPAQQQINDLEKTNAEIQAKNDKLQSFWLIQQNNNVKLTQQRQTQLKDLNLLRKQVLLLEQRVLKLEIEFDAEKKIENDINRSIVQQQYKLTVLGEIFIGKKGYKENLGKENSLNQLHYMQNLKDAELEQIRLKAEIKDLEKHLEELAETMLSNQREMLAWEKKIQSALEAKASMLKERGNTGEVSQMRAEIHRMEVRFSQLKKVQEKLVSDLEQCVVRRDVLTDEAQGRELRQASGYNPRYSFQKRIEALKNNIRQSCNERKQIEKEIAHVEGEHKELRKLISAKERHLLDMQETSKKIDQRLEDAKLYKCQNLELLIRKQKKCKLYELVKSGKHRLLYKSEAAIERELQKAKYTNADLISVVEALIENFPAYRFQLKKIYNTLQVKSS